MGFYTLSLLSRGIYSHVFTLLVRALSAFIAISKECRSGSIYRLKAQLLYILTTVVFIIFAPCDEFASWSVNPDKENVFGDIKGSSAFDVDFDSYTFKEEVQGPVVEQSLHLGTINCSYVNSTVISRAWLKFAQMKLFTTDRKSSMRTSGRCICLLCSWDITFLAPSRKCISFSFSSSDERFTWKIVTYTLDAESDSYMFQKRVLRPVMEHPLGTLNLHLHALVVSRAWLQNREIPSSSTSTNTAMEAWGYCKSFLSSCCSTISVRYVECTSSSVISCEKSVLRNKTGVSTLDVDSDCYCLKNGILGLVIEHSEQVSDSYRLKNRVLGPVVEHPLSTLNCLHLHSVVVSRA